MREVNIISVDGYWIINVNWILRLKKLIKKIN
jgi:hypothetical protein